MRKMELTYIDILTIVLPIFITIVGSMLVWSFRLGGFKRGAETAFRQVEEIKDSTSRLDASFGTYLSQTSPLIQSLLFRASSENPGADQEARVRDLLEKAKLHQLTRPERNELVTNIEEALKKSSLSEMEGRVVIANIDALLAYAEER